jgi:hypothetical protein
MTAEAKKLIGIYSNISILHSLLKDLQDAGFHNDKISVLAKNEPKGQTEHTTIYGVEIDHLKNEVNEPEDEHFFAAKAATAGMLAGLAFLMIPGIGPVLAAGALAASAAAITSLPVDSEDDTIQYILKNEGFPAEHATLYGKHFEKGHLLVMVELNQGETDFASQILRKYNPEIIDTF